MTGYFKMKRWMGILNIVFLLAGCSSALESIEKDYAQINPADGIDAREAVVAAQKEFLRSPYVKQYAVKSAVIIQDFFVRAYPDYWFVSFDSTDFSKGFWHYLVVIQKSSGKLQFAGPYVPLEVVNYDWVFTGETMSWD